MTTLHDIISSIDEQLMLADRVRASSHRTRTTLAAQDKMRKYVLVDIDTAKLAIPIEGLAEIGPMPPLTPLPNLPRWIHGIVNQRGEIISVIDLHHFLQGGSVTPAQGKKLAVLRGQTMKVGICISQVAATVSRMESERRQAQKSPLSVIAPEVFSESLHFADVEYHILNHEKLLGMDRLLHYYLPA